MVDFRDLTICSFCEEGYTSAFEQCPNNCGAGTPSRKTAPVANREHVPATDADKPKSLGTTGFKLSIPIAHHGVIIDYVRHYKNSIKKKKFYDRFYYAGDWMSDFELWFYANWESTGYPLPVPEYKFHAVREWKFDYAWTSQKIAVELEGGAFSRGRHTRGNGYIEDCLKYNEATALGWQVYRFAQKKTEYIEFMKARFR